jgi:hypothetical protein
MVLGMKAIRTKVRMISSHGDRLISLVGLSAVVEPVHFDELA